MRCSPPSRMIGRSLMAAALACNSALLLAADVPTAGPAGATDTTTAPGDIVDVRKAVEYLASDELEGRGVGTKGLDKAADYIAATFKEVGLEPAPGASD